MSILHSPQCKFITKKSYYANFSGLCTEVVKFCLETPKLIVAGSPDVSNCLDTPSLYLLTLTVTLNSSLVIKTAHGRETTRA